MKKEKTPEELRREALYRFCYKDGREGYDAVIHEDHRDVCVAGYDAGFKASLGITWLVEQEGVRRFGS